MKIKFLDLGKQPIANNFLKHKDSFNDEFFFNLNVVFDTESYLVSLESFVPPEKMFNDSYVYHASQSATMRKHFKNISKKIIKDFSPKKVLEIGSNDGVFLFNFKNKDTYAVEPCSNFAKFTNEKGYKTYNNFWNLSLANKMKSEHGDIDLIYSANCMCHVQDLKDAFNAVSVILAKEGVFIFEDPSLSKMINRNSYDQIYDEHAHIFSIMALKNLLIESNLEIFRVEHLNVHGGSNRIYACHKGSRPVEKSVYESLKIEKSLGLDKLVTYTKFAKRVEKSKNDLLQYLKDFKKKNMKIVSYGATSKSTTVFNYCNIGTNIIDYIVDTTPAKQNKFSPGKHIPVYSDKKFDESVDVAFLGAWNFREEIINKESNFIKRGGIFVTHVPEVKIIKE
jgi:methylation protein EvaC